jgi:biotin transport system substrate-specific component
MSSAAIAAPRTVLADLLPGARLRDAGLVVGGAALTGLAAQVSFQTPLSPVPFTMGTLAVLLTGAALGSARGLLSLSLYVLAGVAGVPWFAGHGHGFGGPSFGYLFGYLAAATLVGRLAEHRADRTMRGTTGLMLAGSAIIYAVGASWLAASLHLSAVQAFDLGVRPFLMWDLLKVLSAAVALPAAWKLADRG